MKRSYAARTILLTGVLVLLTALSIVSAIGLGVGTPYDILPPFTVTGGD
jgi:hypothetical protein